MDRTDNPRVPDPTPGSSRVHQSGVSRAERDAADTIREDEPDEVIDDPRDRESSERTEQRTDIDRGRKSGTADRPTDLGNNPTDVRS